MLLNLALTLSFDFGTLEPTNKGRFAVKAKEVLNCLGHQKAHVSKCQQWLGCVWQARKLYLQSHEGVSRAQGVQD